MTEGHPAISPLKEHLSLGALTLRFLDCYQRRGDNLCKPHTDVPLDRMSSAHDDSERGTVIVGSLAGVIASESPFRGANSIRTSPQRWDPAFEGQSGWSETPLVW